MQFIVLHTAVGVVITGRTTLREKLVIDVMKQLQASVPTAGVKMALGLSLQLVLWANPTLVQCCGRRWLSRRSSRAAVRQVKWTISFTLMRPPELPMMFQYS